MLESSPRSSTALRTVVEILPYRRDQRKPGNTGLLIGSDEDPEQHDIEIASMYDKPERVILPMFYQQPTAYAAVMRSAIAINGSFLNTQRMLSQYVSKAYFHEEAREKRH